MKKWLRIAWVGVLFLVNGCANNTGPLSPNLSKSSNGSGISATSNGSGEEYELVARWGSYGSGDGQFDGINDIAVNNSAEVFVIDGNDRVQKFDSYGNFISKWGSRGTGDGQFKGMNGIAVDSMGCIYVAENGNNRVQKFDTNGNFITKWGRWGINQGEFTYPNGLAVDARGYVYVTDGSLVVNYNRIQVFTGNGIFINSWGSRGTGNGQFYDCVAVTADNIGNVYVIDHPPLNHRVQKFDANGNYLFMWGTFGTLPGQLNNPFGITSDNENNIYVSDSYNHRIQKFTSDGDLLAILGGVDANGNLELLYPFGVAVDSAGNVYVGENRNRVTKYAKKLLIISATVDINPKTLNLKSNGNYITAYVELPVGYSVNDIDPASVNMVTPSGASFTALRSEVGDNDSDGIMDLMVKFDRASVQNTLIVGNTLLTIKGNIPSRSMKFEGSELINVIKPGN